MEQEKVGLIATALLLGTTLSWGLYGCLVVQLYIYYTAPATSASSAQHKDPKWLLCIVGILGMFESGFTLLMTHSTWMHIVDQHAAAVIQYPNGPWTTAVCPVITGLGVLVVSCDDLVPWLRCFDGPIRTLKVVSIVQLLLARRIWNLSKMSWNSWKRCITVLAIAMLSLTEGVLCLTAASEFLQGSKDPRRLAQGLHANLAYLVLGLVCDSIITFITITLLWRAKWTITDTLKCLVNEIILRSFEAGVVITLAALAVFYLFLTRPANQQAMILMFSMTRLYTMTLLASLNGRKELPTIGTDHEHTSTVGA